MPASAISTPRRFTATAGRNTGLARRCAPSARGYVLSTKVGRILQAATPGSFDGGLFRPPMPFKPVFDYSYDGVMRSFEDSLARLGTNHVEILLVHDVDVWTHDTEEGAQARLDEAMAGGYRALIELRDQRVIKAIGAGINQWEGVEVRSAGDFDCFLLAGRYTLLEQEALDSFPAPARSATSPSSSAVPTTPASSRPGRLTAPITITRRRARGDGPGRKDRTGLRRPRRQAGQRQQFPLLHPCVSQVIPGARTPDEVERNIEP